MRKLLLPGFILLLTAALLSCGGGGSSTTAVTGPGFVGINDAGVATAPLLIVSFTQPLVPGLQTVTILSDPASDGDIAFDPVLNAFTVTTAPLVVFFGIDELSMNKPEFRGFLTFPLDGFGGRPSVPGDATIVFAELELFVDSVEFAATVPTIIDLVEYPLRGLSAADFSTPPLAFRTLDFFSTDPALVNGVLIDVTPLMQQAQAGLAPDFQVRFLLDTVGALSPSRAPSTAAARSARPTPRSMENVTPNRETSPAGPAKPIDPATRKR